MNDDGRPSWDDTMPRGGRSTGQGVPAVTAPAERSSAPRHFAREGTGAEEPVARADWRLSAWLAGVVVIALGIVGGLVLVVGDVAAPDEARGPKGPPPPASSTVLVVMTGSRDEAVAAALIGLEGREATCVMVPAQLAVEDPDGGSSSFTELVATSEGASDQTAVTALSQSLGVRIDGTWWLTPKALAVLVDFIDGVTVDLQARVTTKGALAEGTAAGERLSGEAAVEHVGTGSGRGDLQRVARFYAVMEGVFLGLPEDPVKRKRALEAVQDEATTFPRERFLTVVGQLHERAREEEMEDSVLPLERRTGSGPYRVDEERLEALLDGPLSYARLPDRPARQLRVLINSDGGSAWRAEQVRERLAAARLTYVADTAEGTDDEATTRASNLPARTRIVVRSESAADRDRGVQVAEALGIPEDRVVVRTIDDATADVVLDVGKDLTRLLKDDSP